MLKIITVPNPVLSSPTKRVESFDDNLKRVINDMEKTLVAQDDPPGVGLAANQVGLNISLFLIKPSEKAKTTVFINPKVLKISDNLIERERKSPGKKTKKKKVKLEGCLSIPRIWGPVKRYDRIFIHYQDPDGQEHLKWFTGFEAIIIQHEIDHLNGIVFTQRSLEQKGQLYREENEELVKIEY